MKSQQTEENRIRQVYADRDAAGRGDLYQWHRPEILFNQYRFRQACSSLMVEKGITDLSGLSCLDVGCGVGAWLRILEEWGGVKERLHGIDLLQDRIEKAIRLSPGIDFRIASGWSVPFEKNTMDIVSAHTVFSSILREDYRKNLADEMQRVLNQSGLILIYDFRVSHPKNPNTIGIRKREILRLFPGFDCRTKSLTLAPPISRKIAAISSRAMAFLEFAFPFFRTHAVYALKRK